MGNWGYWYPGETQYWISYIMFDGAFLEDEYNVLHIFRNSHMSSDKLHVSAVDRISI